MDLIFMVFQRHLFMTTEQLTCPATSLLRSCRVILKGHMQSDAFDCYLSSSPYNFFVTFSCQRLDEASWEDRQALSPRKLAICATCWKASEDRQTKVKECAAQIPLAAFDPFAGAGAFGLALQDAGAIKLTHAVEISVSAAKTLR